MVCFQAQDASAWWSVHAQIQVTPSKTNLDKILQQVFLLLSLQGMLRKAAKAVEQNKEFTAEQAHNYHMSVTEREVMSSQKCYFPIQ